MPETKRRGRPRTIHINPDDLLRGIHRAWKAEVAFFQRETKKLRKNSRGLPGFRVDREIAACQEQLRELRGEHWVPYDLPAFLGRNLSASEKVVARRVMREMESAGLIELDGAKASAARLTRKGRSHVRDFSK